MLDRAEAAARSGSEIEIARSRHSSSSVVDLRGIYYEMRGRQIVLPKSVEDHPRRELLEWHNREMFLG